MQHCQPITFSCHDGHTETAGELLETKVLRNAPCPAHAATEQS